MSRLGVVIVLGLLLMGAIGLVLAAMSFSRVPVPDVDVPVAQVVHGGKAPRRQPRIRVSAGRLMIGIVLMVLGGAGVMFVYAAAGLASMANH